MMNLQLVDNEGIIKSIIHHQQFPLWKKAIQWENGLGGSGGSERIF
jgi:hypothetical protein